MKTVKTEHPADLEIVYTQEQLVKFSLVKQINSIIVKRRLTKPKMVILLGLTQLQFSKLLLGQFDKFSIERLIRLLNRLGHDVRIEIKGKPGRKNGKGRLKVRFE